MVVQDYLNQMRNSADAIAALIQDVPVTQAHWKPAADAWSILEVICHLYDEERDDFRQRLDLTLYHPDQEPPAIDPEGWVVARGYAQRDHQSMVAAFLEERQHSLAWLNQLGDQNWEQSVNHPRTRGLRAGDLLVAWAAHDLLHIRQLNELRYLYLAHNAAPFAPAYAGDWE